MTNLKNAKTIFEAIEAKEVKDLYNEPTFKFHWDSDARKFHFYLIFRNTADVPHLLKEDFLKFLINIFPMRDSEFHEYDSVKANKETYFKTVEDWQLYFVLYIETIKDWISFFNKLVKKFNK